MVKEIFIVRQTKAKDESRFVENGTEKLTSMTFKGVDAEGIVSQINFKGSPDAMNRRFAGFIGGSAGDVEITISTSTTQTTMITAMANATKKKSSKAAKSAAPVDDPDFEDKLDELSQP